MEVSVTMAGEASGAECEEILRAAHGEETVSDARKLRLWLRGGLAHRLAQQMVVGGTANESESHNNLASIIITML